MKKVVLAGCFSILQFFKTRHLRYTVGKRREKRSLGLWRAEPSFKKMRHLKNQCHEIFRFRFFSWSFSPGPLIKTADHLEFFSKNVPPASLLPKSANCQILNQQSHQISKMCQPQIANPEIFIINPKITNPQICTKYFTTLSQNSHKSPLFKRFFYYVQILIRALPLWFFWKVIKYCKVCICWLPEVLNPLITKNFFPANSKVPHFQKVWWRKLTLSYWVSPLPDWIFMTIADAVR